VPSLKDIRRRISSVKNTQQITKAMKLVAAARLRRAQQASSSAKPYSEKLEAIAQRVISEILSTAGTMDSEKLEKFLTELHPLLSTGNLKLEEGAKRKVAVVVVSSDRGLCGAYNSNLSKFAIKTIAELKTDTSQEIHVFYYGKKGFESCSRRGVKGENVANFWAGKFAPSKTDKVAQLFTEKFLAGEFQSIQVIYTQFKSVMTQTPSIKQVLPLAVENIDSTSGLKSLGPEFLYEPSRVEVLAQLLPSLVKTQFYRFFADSLASEFGSRMTAMDNATRNAGSMISRLTLEANRVRQAAITKELMEIVSGAEAIKG